MKTKQLILLRHAKSDWFSGAQTDFERPLNERGIKNAGQVGSWFKDNSTQPDKVLCSPATRTRETLNLVMQAAGWRELDIDFSDNLYLCSTSALKIMIMNELSGCEHLLVINHNPTLENLLLSLCPTVAFNKSQKLMTTASLAIFQFDDPQMTHPNLEHFINPRDLTLSQ